jgi:hypothetical protein
MTKQIQILMTALLVIAVILGVSAPALASGPSDLRVMNYNIYEGTNFRQIGQAQTLNQFIAAVGGTMWQVRATDPPARMQAIAKQIVDADPTLVSLEEVAQWATGSFDPITQTCGRLSVEIDTLQELLASLSAQGGHYEVAVQATQWAFPPVPGVLPGVGYFCVQFTGFNAILVRSDAPGLSWTNAQSGLYAARTYANTPIGSLPLPRAWESIDVRLNARPFRFIGTDFDAVNATVRKLQGEELRTGPANTSQPVIIAMDSNSQAAPLPQDATYLEFLAAGYRDAWADVHPTVKGFTCCQGEFVNNDGSQLWTRIDLVLTLGAVEAQQVELFGDKPWDKTGDGLWPSDHVGIAAQVTVH